MEKTLDLQMEEAYFSSIKSIGAGEIVKGKIVEVNPKDVVVDIGFKSEAIIPRSEFLPTEQLESGKEIEVYIEDLEDEDGNLVVSYQKAKKLSGWKKLVSQYEKSDIAEGIVARKIKGGFMVDIFGVEGFLPGSLSAFRHLTDEEIIGKPFTFKIIKLSKHKQNFIVSRRDAIKEEREKNRRKLWDTLKIGEVRKGKVKSITNFGAFIDLGGIDGLLHIGDMSWKKINHPSEIVAVGSEVEVIVLNMDKDSGKISLGLKQLTPDPWEEIESKYPAGSVVQGKIVNILNYGIFVELEKGIEGLVHISEISWVKRISHPENIYAIGDTVEAKVINIDAANKKISLSIKQIEKDPWIDIENKVEPGSKVKGKVSGFIRDGAIVDLEFGVEGIIYNKDISWTKRINQAQHTLKKNQEYEFAVLEVNSNERRIILGLKQLAENPWPRIIEEYPAGRIIEREVVKKTNFGIFVKIEEDLEGLVFSEEIDEETKEKIQPGDKIKVKVVKIDPKFSKISLSCRLNEPEPENNPTD